MFGFLKVLIFISMLLVPVSLFAKFMGPTYLPAERLIANTLAYLKEHPDSHETLYALARIHYLAFINQSDLVGAYNDGKPPRIAPDWILGDYLSYARSEQAQKLALKELGLKSYQDITKERHAEYYTLLQVKLKKLIDEKWQPEKISQEALLNHGKEAVIHFKKALAIEPNNALYHLGLACFYHQYLNYKKTTELKKEPTELKEITLEKALDFYYKAYSLSIEDEIKSEYQPKSGLNSLVSFEAGNAFLQITDQINTLSKKILSAEERKKNEEISKNISKLKALPQGAVTPIIFTLENQVSISELLNPDLNVNFDLDGNGSAELWPWVKSTTGFLVWDPQAKGKITSGRQMFGSVTWWIFFKNGYQALDSLDDNRDGQISDEELIGITTWFDKNGNGISEASEMIDLKTLGVVSIGTKPTGETSGMPMHDGGITLINGKTLCTYDRTTLPYKK